MTHLKESAHLLQQMSITPEELIKDQFETHYRENEEFLVSFEVLQEDLHQ